MIDIQMEQLVREYQRLKDTVESERRYLNNLYHNSYQPNEERRRTRIKIDMYGKVIALCMYLAEAHQMIRLNKIERARYRYNRACNAAVGFFELREKLGPGLRLHRQLSIIHRDFGHLNLD